MTDSLVQVAAITDHAPVKRLSCLAAMQERKGEIVCFTPALLVTVAGLPFDPAQEYSARFNVPADQQPFCVELGPDSPPFFAGLPALYFGGKMVDWGRRLYAVPTAYAKPCLDFLAGVVVHRRETDTYAVSAPYDIFVPDPADISTQIPTRVFGVLYGEQLTYLRPRDFERKPPIVATASRDAALPDAVSPIGDATNVLRMYKDLRGAE